MLAIIPSVPQHFATGEILAKWEEVCDTVFDYEGPDPSTSDIIAVLVFAEIPKLVGDIKVLKIISN